MRCARAVDKMASGVCVCAVVLLAVACRATNIVKGLYCQDPDSGKLHPVNTTWPSQTFCGNYTCKLRMQNTTETEYTPIQKIDITKFGKQNEDLGNDMAISSSDNSIVITKKTDNNKHPIFHKDFFKLKTKDNDPIINNKDVKDNDGYLTESEIKTITDMLHTVRKSDVEALVDIYNLAQDCKWIYKEIDSISKEKLVTQFKNAQEMVKTDNKQSYWYEPIHYNSKHVDMSHDETNIISTKRPALDSNPTLLKGTVSDSNFAKLPYYYPISNFQRKSSYTHSKPISVDLEKSSTENKPCSKSTNKYNYAAMSQYSTPMEKSETAATIRPATLLPYPFSYIYHNNVKGYPPNNYLNYPWAHIEYNKHKNYLHPYYGAYIVQIPTYNGYNKINSPEKAKLEFSSPKEEILNKILESSSEKKTLPDWQTGPLSENVIEEVRAHLEKPKSLKPVPLKKNIKLERVGKVIKLDELIRSRREMENHDINPKIEETFKDSLEAYIERTVCENSTEPGYFSIGNMSQPYPACCPQKLDSIHTTQEIKKNN